MFKIIKHILTQVAIATCVFMSGYGQYLNKLDVIPNSEEFATVFHWKGDTLYGGMLVQDTLWTNHGYGTYHLKRYDNNFETEESHIIIDTGRIYGPGKSIVLKDDAFYIGGFKDTAYYDSDTTYGYVLKLDTLGIKKWEKRLYPSEEKVSISHVIEHDSLLILAGRCYNPISGVSPNLSYVFVFAIDTSGAEIWSKTFPNLNLQTLSFSSTQDGGFLLSTFSQLNGSINQTRVYKLDHLGDTEWSRTIGDGLTNPVYLSASEMPNGEVLCYGSQVVNNIDQSYLVKLSSGGVILKDTLNDLSPNNKTDYFSLSAKPYYNTSGKIYLVGEWDIPYNCSFLCEINSDLDILWINKHEKRLFRDIIYHVSAYPPNPDFIFMAGLSYPTPGVPTESVDAWFVVVDSLGCEVANCTSGISEWKKEETHNMKLYPNPSNGKVTIDLSSLVEISNTYSIYITDIQGKQIEILTINNIVLEYEMSNIDQGIYLVHLLKNGERIETQKLVLTK